MSVVMIVVADGIYSVNVTLKERHEIRASSEKPNPVDRVTKIIRGWPAEVECHGRGRSTTTESSYHARMRLSHLVLFNHIIILLVQVRPIPS